MDTESPAAKLEPKPTNGAHQCTCGAAVPPTQEHFVYALGKFEARFMSVALEREFRHQQGKLGEGDPHDRALSLVRTLRENPHLAERAAYFLSIMGVPAYFVAPTSRSIRDCILEALESTADDGQWSVVIGRRGGIAPPAAAGGILAPLVAADAIYNFTFENWYKALHSIMAPALSARQADSTETRKLAEDMFRRVVRSTESVGGNDPQRALNYVLMQHPGPLLAAAERQKHGILDRIETRQLSDLGARKVVAVIFSFIDRTTGVADRLFCRIDVTEEWPFVADAPSGAAGSPVALIPYVENELWAESI